MKQLLREGPEEERFEMSEEEKAYLAAVSGVDEVYIAHNTVRISKDNVVRLLDQYYGLTLEDLPKMDSSSVVYWEETDYFYIWYSDTAGRMLTVTDAVTLEDGTIRVFYRDELGMQSTGEMILKPTEDGYQILSNQTSM